MVTVTNSSTRIQPSATSDDRRTVTISGTDSGADVFGENRSPTQHSSP
jgi:hypothetical protein